MIHIAICDDEKDFVEHLKGLLLRYSRGRGKKLSDVEFRQLVHILENRNSSKAMSARGRNGNRKCRCGNFVVPATAASYSLV